MKTGVRISVGAQNFQKPPTDDVEQFLSMLRFVSKEKVNALTTPVDPDTENIVVKWFESLF
jgi:hypothetical protein